MIPFHLQTKSAANSARPPDFAASFMKMNGLPVIVLFFGCHFIVLVAKPKGVVDGKAALTGLMMLEKRPKKARPRKRSTGRRRGAPRLTKRAPHQNSSRLCVSARYYLHLAQWALPGLNWPLLGAKMQYFLPSLDQLIKLVTFESRH